MEKWTVEQRQAIDAVGCSVLVSASAGSGKTSVMIERIIQMVLSGLADVRHILVVTFVSTAAADMKRKLYEALRARVAGGEDTPRLRRQLDELDIAAISTLHSFCADLLREYFYEAELDPQFAIVSGQDVEVLLGEALDDTIERFAEADDADFAELVEIFTRRRRDTAFRELLLTLREFLCARRDPEAYLAGVLARGYRDTEAVEAYVNDYLSLMADGHARALASAARAAREAELPRHAEILEEIAAGISAVRAENGLAANMRALEQLERPGTARKPKEANFLQEEAVERYAETRRRALDFAAKAVEQFGSAMRARSAESAEGAARRIDKLAEVMRFFTESYTAKKREKNAVDFSDLEHLALKVLDSPRVREELSARYRYVFVDEYQDINDVQEAILAAVSGNNDLFMVGDVKQSIYGFRLCDPGIFTEKYYRYRERGGGLAIDLNRNFRSAPGVLDFANAVFSRLMRREFGGTDYAESSVLEAGLSFPGADGLPAADVRVIRSVRAPRPVLTDAAPYDLDDETPEEEDAAAYEGELIARVVEEYLGREIYRPKTGETRRVGYDDIVILTRSYSGYVRRVQKYLLRAGIPVISAGDSEPGTEVRLLIDLLSVIDNPRNDVPLLAVMRSVFGGFTDEELAALRQAGGEEQKFYHECVLAAAERGEAPLERKAKAFLEKMRRYRLVQAAASISRVLEQAISESGYDLYLLAQRNGRERYLRVNSYLNQLENSELGYSLTAYLRQIDASGSLALGDTTVAGAGGVRLMSIHKSKGLEFPVVILAATGQQFNQTDLAAPVLLDKTYGLAMDSYDLTARTKCANFTKEALRVKKRRELLEEELRILYVAVTRAQNHLVVTGRADTDGWNGDAGLSALLSCRSYLDFMSKECIRALSGCEGLPYRFLLYPESSLKGREGKPAAALAVTEGSREAAEEMEKVLYFTYPYESAVRARQKLTVTAVSEKEGFSEEREKAEPAEVLLRETALEKGVSYHAVLEHADLFDTSLPAVRRTIDGLVARGVVPDASLVDAALVKRCLDSPLLDEARRGKTYREKTFMLYLTPKELGTGEGGDRVLMQGKIDMLIVGDAGATVVDFKSARIPNESAARERYARQLALYALAVERVLELPVKRRVVYSIEGGKAFDV